AWLHPRWCWRSPIGLHGLTSRFPASTGTFASWKCSVKVSAVVAHFELGTATDTEAEKKAPGSCRVRASRRRVFVLGATVPSYVTFPLVMIVTGREKSTSVSLR